MRHTFDVWAGLCIVKTVDIAFSICCVFTLCESRLVFSLGCIRLWTGLTVACVAMVWGPSLAAASCGDWLVSHAPPRQSATQTFETPATSSDRQPLSLPGGPRCQHSPLAGFAVTVVIERTSFTAQTAILNNLLATKQESATGELIHLDLHTAAGVQLPLIRPPRPLRTNDGCQSRG